MKTFKSLFKIAIVISAFFLYSCEKEQFDSNQSSITNEINKVETIYQKGDIKIETIADQNFQRIETSASESYKEKVRQELEKSYTKQTTYLKSAGNTVGVIKNGSCGSYQEFYWHMDCEDSGNNSTKSGWVGDCDVNSSKNVILDFCVVDGAYFERTNNDYAVLNLYGGSSWPYGVSFIMRYIDNEDDNNINSSSRGGVVQPGWIGDCSFANNTRLGFYYYPYTSGSNTYPSLGISYGVFGRFGSNQGSIYSDDENSGNANLCYRANYDYSTWQLGSSYAVSSVSNILTAGANTTLYLCKVN